MSDKPIISVEATGTASAAPDVARVRLFTFAEDPTPADALTSCSLLTERVLAALREAGVASSDLVTISIDLNQQHRRDGDRAAEEYRASSNLEATVRRPEDLGRVIAAAVDAAGTGVGISNVRFDVDDRAPLVSLARRDAVAGALRAAHELAEAAGLVLGPLVELVEGGGGRRPPPGGPVLMAAARQALAPPPVELGELSVAVTVSAVFEVSPAPTG
ncbi:MAG: SIMPL domain-containing protein [Acidimicrobiales bacterium]|jgi:hypothetical protein